MNRLDRFLGYTELVESRRVMWKMLLAEFVGTLFLVLVGCGSCTNVIGEGYTPTIVQIAFAFGLAVATMARCIGHVSGGHINPAVTCGMLVTGKLGLLRALLYIAAQCLGAIAGAAVLRGLVIEGPEIALGQTTVNRNLTSVQGFGVEFLITFMLVFTVFAVCDEQRAPEGGSGALAIGLSVVAGHLVGVSLTGASMNSARALGPAVLTGVWENHWVYWLGPCLGGMAAGILYETAFKAKSPEEDKNGYFMQLATREPAPEKETA